MSRTSASPLRGANVAVLVAVLVGTTAACGARDGRGVATPATGAPNAIAATAPAATPLPSATTRLPASIASPASTAVVASPRATIAPASTVTPADRDALADLGELMQLLADIDAQLAEDAAAPPQEGSN